MFDELYGSLPKLASELVPISVVGWLGIWFLFRPVRSRGSVPTLGGPFTFLTLWGFAILADWNTHGRASPAIHALYLSFLAIGSLRWLVGVIAGACRRSPHRQGGRGD